MSDLSSMKAAQARGPVATPLAAAVSANPLARTAARTRRLFVAALVVGAPIGWGVGALGLLGHWALG